MSRLPSKTFTAYEVDFFVFSGTAFSTSKFMSSSETTAKCSHLKLLKQDLHLIGNSSFENWGISLGYSPILVGAYCVTLRVLTNRVKIFDGL